MSSLVWLLLPAGRVLVVGLATSIHGTNEPVRLAGKTTPRTISFIHGELDQCCLNFDELEAEAEEPEEAWHLPGAGPDKVSETHTV